MFPYSTSARGGLTQRWPSMRGAMRTAAILGLSLLFMGSACAQLLLPDAPRARQAEAEAFAREWLVLVDAADAKGSYDLLTDSFAGNMSLRQWRSSIERNARENGKLKSRSLRRIVWYDNPANAPLPGTYAAVEFDGVYANAPQHFQYVVLHSMAGEPFRVMRSEVTSILDSPPDGVGVER